MRTICPKNPYVLVRDDNPSVRIPAPCGSYSCPTCRGAKIFERVRLTAWGASVRSQCRMITLTKLPYPWQRARMQVRDWVRRVRKTYVLEMAWSIEENPKKTGYHAHALSHGEHMPTASLRRLWGERYVDVRMVSHHASDYMSKCATIAGYQVKQVEKHLEINGGRALHFTRGFLHGLTSREVLKILQGEYKWHLEHASTLSIEGIEEEADGLPPPEDYGEIPY